MSPGPVAPRPTEVELVRDDAILRIAWDDGHQSVYPLRYLRGFCPCAQCQGHAQGSWTFVSVDDPAIAKIEEMGNYALSINFTDGHNTGIYSFEILRELCPCDACRKLHGIAHAMAQLPDGERL